MSDFYDFLEPGFIIECSDSCLFLIVFICLKVGENVSNENASVLPGLEFTRLSEILICEVSDLHVRKFWEKGDIGKTQRK